MDAAVWWDLDVSLSEQETSTMLRMFMDAAIGCVLDVSLSEKQTCAIYTCAIYICYILYLISHIFTN
jgi:hypothetical protein